MSVYPLNCGYNQYSYSNFNVPTFGNAYAVNQPFANYQSNPVAPNEQGDRVEFSTANKKSSAVKTALTLGAIAGLVVCAIALCKKGKPVKLAEHIDFTPAKTIEEAKAFARQHLGIKKFKVDDLQIANFVNEGLANAVNINKGKIVLPRSVVTKSGDYCMSTNPFFKSLTINPKGQAVETLGLKDAKLIETYNNGDFLQKIQILHQTARVDGEILRGKFHELYHELGHLNHSAQSPELFEALSKCGTGYDLENCLKKGGDVNPMIMSHMDECAKIERIRELGVYAIEYPNEYVADVYAHMLSNQGKSRFRDDVLALYYKYGGPKIGV